MQQLETTEFNPPHSSKTKSIESKRVILALHRLPGIGPIKLAEILNHHDTITRSQCFDSADNCRFAKGKADWAAVDKELTWAEAENCHILFPEDDIFPPLLKQIHATPQVLYVRGDVNYLLQSTLAIIGSRNSSHEGLELAHAFAKHFSNLGFTIVSGLADGIDGSAHKGALLGKGGTIAVLGNGLDKIYPAHHCRLAQTLVEQGALVSEFPLGTPPINTNFPRRNRIISGLSQGVIVVEAALKSGSLITAQYALEQNREVFAVPGSIHNTLAKGCHALIRQGAKLVESAEHVLEELGKWENTLANHALQKTFSKEIKRVGKSKTKAMLQSATTNLELPLLDLAYQTLLDQIGQSMTPVDVLIERCQLTAAKVSSMLLELEMQGYVRSVQGGYINIVN